MFAPQVRPLLLLKARNLDAWSQRARRAAVELLREKAQRS